eukprot:3722045-Alexandrium_andersonii.AAC.1
MALPLLLLLLSVLGVGRDLLLRLLLAGVQLQREAVEHAEHCHVVRAHDALGRAGLLLAQDGLEVGARIGIMGGFSASLPAAHEVLLHLLVALVHLGGEVVHARVAALGVGALDGAIGLVELRH